MIKPAHPILACALALLSSCGGGRHSAGAAEDPAAAAEQAQRYQEMISRAEKKAREGRPEERIQQAIQEFQQQVGRVPTNLPEIVSAGILTELPKPPPGRAYYYAPEKGRVVLVQAPDRPQGAAARGGNQPFIP